jgi:hypothetical protein
MGLSAEEILDLASIGKQQASSLEYVKRFSLCDCLTANLHDSYTAMNMGIEVFLTKVVAGEKLIVPYANKVPIEELPRFRPIAYKIPKGISTFLWSPFHDAVCQYYDFGDGIRHSRRHEGPMLVGLGAAKRIPDVSVDEIAKQIGQLDAKVSELWRNPTRILVLYHYERMSDLPWDLPIKKRLIELTRLSKQILKWPVAEMRLSELDGWNNADVQAHPEKSWNGWDHYDIKGIHSLYGRIAEIEDGQK